MSHKEEYKSAGGSILLTLIFINAIILKAGFINNPNWYWLLSGTLPLLAIAIYDVKQKKHAILRNYPLIGRLRYLLERIIRQRN